MTTAAPAATNPVASSNLTPEQIAELKNILLREMMERYPDIIQMLFQTPSLAFEEKKYWLQLMPLMAPDHIERLRGILVNERQKLAEINARYEAGVQALEKIARPSQEEMEKQRKAIRAAEAASSTQNVDEDLTQQLKAA